MKTSDYIHKLIIKGAFGLFALASLASCVAKDDESASLPPRKDSPKGELTQFQKDSLYTDSVKKLSVSQMIHRHTMGDGFHIIITGDGFTKADMSNGKFATAIENTQNALFEKEPMKSLADYVDIISVAVPSLHDGVDYLKRNTGYRTYLSQGNNSGIHGDSLTILNCAAEALIKQYGITQQQELNNRINKTVVITLLNTDIYKGVTLLACDENAKDKIPNGYSLSYVPAYATIDTPSGKLNVFNYLVRHEGVGHGIAKLADEYYYADGRVPSNETISNYVKLYQYGFYQNTSYSNSADKSEAQYVILRSSWLYPFTQNPDYAGEDRSWYAGAYEYATKFRRFGNYSIMNGTVKQDDPSYDANTDVFNVASRAMIYKRIMRAASPSWNWDYTAFCTFDAPARKPVVSATRGVKATRPTAVVKAPALAAPRIMKVPTIKLAE